MIFLIYFFFGCGTIKNPHFFCYECTLIIESQIRVQLLNKIIEFCLFIYDKYSGVYVANTEIILFDI